MPKTLLLADDSVTIQKVVGISFANEDVVLLTVDNGDDALATCREARPDVLLADVVMPGKNGYEVCEAVKSDPTLSHIPVLLLTGTFEAFDEDRAQRAGADGHITKPFEAQALVDQVNGLLSRAAAGPAVEPAAPVAEEDSLGLRETPATSAADEAYDFFDDEVTAPGTAATPATGVTAASHPEAAIGSGDSFSFDAPLEVTEEPAAVSRPAFQFDPNSAPDETMAILPDGSDDSFSNAQTVPPPLDDDDLTQLGLSELAPESEDEPALATEVAEELDFPASHIASDVGSSIGSEAANDLPEPQAPAAVAATPEPQMPMPSSIDFGSDELSVVPEPEDSFTVAEAMEPAGDAVLDPDGGRDYDVSSSDLGDPLGQSATAPPALAPQPAPEPPAPRAEAPMLMTPAPEPVAPEPITPAPALAPEPIAPAPALAPEPITPAPAAPAMAPEPVALASDPGPPPETATSTPALEALDTTALRAQVHDTLEKVAWEALGPVTEAIVKEAVARVEKIAWEVIPQMAETLIQEEIRKLKG